MEVTILVNWPKICYRPSGFIIELLFECPIVQSIIGRIVEATYPFLGHSHAEKTYSDISYISVSEAGTVDCMRRHLRLYVPKRIETKMMNIRLKSYT